MTVATIGTGDVLPGSQFERVLAIICMIIGGSAYAYIIGSVCSILSNRNRSLMHFRQRMDDLHEFNRELNLPAELRSKLQAFFHHSQASIRQRFFHDLLKEMSPVLRAEVALLSYGKWIRHVSFLRGRSHDEDSSFAAAVALTLRTIVFQGGDPVYRRGDLADELYIVSKGLCVQVQPLVTFRVGDPFGTEAVLRHSRRDTTVTTLTRTMDVLALSKGDLDRILHDGDFHHIRTRIHWATMQVGLRHGMMKLAGAMKQARKMLEDAGFPSSIIDVSDLGPALYDLRGTPRTDEQIATATTSIVTSIIKRLRAQSHRDSSLHSAPAGSHEGSPTHASMDGSGSPMAGVVDSALRPPAVPHRVPTSASLMSGTSLAARLVGGGGARPSVHGRTEEREMLRLILFKIEALQESMYAMDTRVVDIERSLRA